MKRQTQLKTVALLSLMVGGLATHGCHKQASETVSSSRPPAQKVFPNPPEVRPSSTQPLKPVKPAPSAADIAPLLKSLKSSDAKVRQSAAESLGKVGAVDALIPILQTDPSVAVRGEAATALGMTGDSKALEPLVAVLSATDNELRVWAVAALGALRNAGAIAPLSRTLRNAISFKPSDLGGIFMLEESKVVRVIKGRKTLPDVASTAAIALGRIGGEALDVLAATLKSPDPWLRHSAARGLGFDKSNRSVQLLVGALGDRSDFVRDGIVEVLQKATGEKLGPDVVKWREYASKLHSDQAGKPVEASARGQGGTTKEPPRPRGATREYQDAANGLSLQYPAAWKEMGPAEARQIMGAATSRYLTVVIYDPTDRTQNINVQVAPVDAKDLTEASYREFAKQMDQSMPSGFAGFRKISSQVAPLLDMASLQYVFEFTRPDGVLLRQKQLRTGKPGREVSITMTAKADLYEKTDAACFKTIVDTLKLK